MLETIPVEIKTSEKEKAKQKRKKLGQVFTPGYIADLIISLCLEKKGSTVLDPSGGDGVFLERTIAYKTKVLKETPEETFKTCYTVELDDELHDHLCKKFPFLSKENIIREDFFDFANSLLQNSERRFDVIIGNPPYVRQELIDRHYKDKLSRFRRIFPQGVLTERSGLHAYFLAISLLCLKPHGKLGFVLPESFLTSGADENLRSYLAENYRILYVIYPEGENWFKTADIRTCIVVVENAPPLSEDKTRIVFLKLKNSVNFTKIFSDGNSNEDEYYKCLTFFSTKVKGNEETFEREWFKLSIIFQRELTEKTATSKSLTEAEKPLLLQPLKLANQKSRVIFQFLIRKQLLLREEKTAVRPNWKVCILKNVNQQIRKIFSSESGGIFNASENVVPLKDVALVKRGFTTGADPWFYVKKVSESPDKKIVKVKSEDGSLWDVESEYLFPVLCNPRDFNKIEILVEKEVNTMVVLIPSQANLENTFVKKYVTYGERTPYAMGKGKVCIPAETSTCRGRKKWYCLEFSTKKPARVFFVKSWDKRYRHFLSDSPLYANQRFYCIYPHCAGKKSCCLIEEVVASFLNSFIFACYFELIRPPMALGAIEATVEDVKSLPFPNVEKIDEKLAGDLTEVFSILCKREIKTIFDEVKEEDRKELDELVLLALGIKNKSRRKEILELAYDCLIHSVEKRIAAKL